MTLMMELKEQRREGFDEGVIYGENKGRNEGIELTIIASIRNLMETVGWTAQQAMDALKVPADEREKYAAQL